MSSQPVMCGDKRLAYILLSLIFWFLFLISLCISDQRCVKVTAARASFFLSSSFSLLPCPAVLCKDKGVKYILLPIFFLLSYYLVWPVMCEDKRLEYFPLPPFFLLSLPYPPVICEDNRVTYSLLRLLFLLSYYLVWPVMCENKRLAYILLPVLLP